MECPQEVIYRAELLYSNGFSGFLEPATSGRDKDFFILCWPHSVDDNFDRLESIILPELSQRVGVTSLRLGTHIRGDYLAIHWTEYPKRFAVLTELLVFGIAFETETQGNPYFRPEDAPFTQALLEKRVIEQTENLIKGSLWSQINHARCEEWNWTTEEGKQFSRRLRGLAGVRYNQNRQNFYDYKLFRNYDEMSLLTLT